MREILPIGTTVPINGKDYRIEAVIGEGASCIVYDASAENEFGAIRKYRLKECYPHHVPCHRDGDQLIWEDTTKQAAVFSRFKKSINILSALRDERSLGNYFTEPEPYEANGTLYAVMPVNHAKTYDKDRSKDLHQILKTVLKLTRIVDRLHSYGYLHLDIKPENFLVEYDPDPNIWLFDVDSLIPVSDLRNGRTTCYSYSKEWAAPELVQAKLNRVCPATDLYSIGAILFQKVMGRPVSNDDIGLFAEWDFDGEIFEDVNPKVQRYLNEIFKHTLSATPQYRYQTASELEAVLVEACSHIGKPFLVSHDLQTSAHFVGREEEIDNIHGSFADGQKAVFLHGIGGIGKSSVAIAYANRYRKEYDTILFCRYLHSLEDILDDLVEEIQDFNGSTKDGRRMLKRLLDGRTLLIVDNFDVATDAEPYLGEFLKLHARMIFTTRTDFREVLSSLSEQIEISEMSYEQLEVLFSKISRLEIGSAEQSDLLHDLLRTVDYHTYLTDLLARQVVSSGWSLETLARKMKRGLHQLESAEKIKSHKDGLIVKQTIPNGIRVLFNLADLEEDSKQVLRNLCILCGFVAVTKDTYKLFCTAEIRSFGSDSSYSFYTSIPESSPDIEILNELQERGWVQEHRGIFTLHPLIAELIQIDLKPCCENCSKLYGYMDAILQSFAANHDYDEADERKHYNYYELLSAFYAAIDFSDYENRRMARDFLCAVIDCADIEGDLGWLEHSGFTTVKERLLEEIRTYPVQPLEKFEIQFVLFKAIMCQGRYSGFPEEHKPVLEANLFQAYHAVANAIEGLDGDSKEYAAETFYRELQWNIVNSSYGHQYPMDFVHQMCRIRPEIEDALSPNTKELYGIPLSDQDKEKLEQEHQNSMQYFREKSNEELAEEQRLELWEKRMDEIRSALRDTTDKLAFCQELYSNSRLEIYQVAALLLEECAGFFNYISSPWWWPQCSIEKIRAFVQTTDWDELERIIDFAEELQASSKWRKEFDGYSVYDDEFYVYKDTGEPVTDYIYDTTMWRAELAVIRSEWDTFHSLMSKGIPLTLYLTMAPKVLHRTGIVHLCWNLDKCRFILPYLIQEISDDEEDAHFEERDRISYFENIIEYAKKAMTEVDEHSDPYHEYQQIVQQYTDRINRITGKRYMLKSDMEPQT